MKIGIMGTGYVGLVAGLVFAKRGDEVVCYDIDEEKIALLEQGHAPISEPGVDSYLSDCLERKTVSFTANLDVLVEHADVIFGCLPTPSVEDSDSVKQFCIPAPVQMYDIKAPPESWKANTAIFEKAFDNLLGRVTKPVIFVSKSTVPPGTARKLYNHTRSVGKENLVTIVSNPEHLREGSAINDFEHPDRIITGYGGSVEQIKHAQCVMEDLFSTLLHNQNPLFKETWETAELSKLIANYWLALRICGANVAANICDVVDADYQRIKELNTCDERIGKKFLYAGPGFGGSCFPKDLKSLAYAAHQYGLDSRMIMDVWRQNELQKQILPQKVCAYFEHYHRIKDLYGKTIAVWGLSFKPKTDDIREAPSLVLISHLLYKKATVNAYDPIPKARENVKKLIAAERAEWISRLHILDDQYKSVSKADALVTITEHDEFETLNYGLLKELMHELAIFDGRGRYDPQKVKDAGFWYEGIGRRL
ncbi:MAG: nucleotide sugar dehydrogenase [Nanoarchaeota archaeon]